MPAQQGSIAAPYYTYCDQLIGQTWVRWSESILNREHDARYSGARGFQEVIVSVEGTVSANERTRANECYRAGFLRGRLVREQSETSRRQMPRGWELVQSDQHVHTRLGYVAYALGKGLAENGSSSRLQVGLSGVAAIMLLQAAVSHPSTPVSLLTVFEHLRSEFPRPANVDSHKWNRYLAAAMFCTLNQPHRDAVIAAAVSRSRVDSLALTRDGQRTIVTRQTLPDLVANYSVADVDRPKDSLFWIGDARGQELPRGLYTVAMRHWSVFVQAVVAKEQDLIASGHDNPLATLMLDGDDGERGCVLARLEQMTSTETNIAAEWRRLMKSLAEGVHDALVYLEGGGETVPRVFFAHGTMDADVVGSDATVVVPKATTSPGAPRAGDHVVVGKQRLAVTEVLADGANWTLRVQSLDDREPQTVISSPN